MASNAFEPISDAGPDWKLCLEVALKINFFALIGSVIQDIPFATPQTAVACASKALRALRWALITRPSGLTRRHTLLSALILVQSLGAVFDTFQGAGVLKPSWFAL